MKAALLTLTAVIALALAAPTWAAGISPDDRGYSKATSPSLNQSMGPDDRAVSRATSPSLTQSMGPDDRAVSRATSLDTDWQPAPTVVRISHRSFDWTDAGVGAASGFGIALVLIGGMLVLRGRIVATA